MDTLVNNHYIIDNKVFNCIDINHSFNPDTYQLYEVLRTREGVLLFLDDHLERLLEAIPPELPEHNTLLAAAKEQLHLLVTANNNTSGNVKLLCRLEQATFSLAAYYIPHSYPDNTLYETGIHLCSFEVERPNPHLKQISVANQIAAQVNAKPQLRTSYEVLLIDHNQFITEGRRSNFFLIKDNQLITAPDAYVLMGITRKYVLQLARQLNIEIVQQRVKLSEINDYEAAFICGTSPKILPVYGIDNVTFNPRHPILLQLMQTYDTRITSYIGERSPNV